ncbi:hypothetical protein BJV74DRAFT_863981 [Russula compacta]|nr:hypothetical protein BJV74DRAFT_863981 [Russula compacta]
MNTATPRPMNECMNGRRRRRRQRIAQGCTSCAGDRLTERVLPAPTLSIPSAHITPPSEPAPNAVMSTPNLSPCCS